mgnify:CR=1 FL=1
MTTEECDADIAYKEAYINAKEEDIVIVKSPVGMPGRAIKNKFLERVAQGPVKVERCFRCLEHCNPAETPYCITKALINAAEGKIDEALLFCGSNAYRSSVVRRSRRCRRLWRRCAESKKLREAVVQIM